MPKIKNLIKAIKRTLKAVKTKETVVLFGDADLDGITSTLIIEEALKTLGLQVKKVYFPDRETEGYSLSQEALLQIKSCAPGLLILLDCGVSNHQELKMAHKLGFDILVLDHHEVIKEVPKTGIIVDVKQPKDDYPFKNLSTSSLAYIFARELLGKNLFSKNDESLKELSALGVIADMMEIADVNKEVVESAFKTIFSSFRVGFQVLRKVVSLKEGTAREFFSQMVGILNITEIENGLTLSYLLLKEANEEKALELAKKLYFDSEKRRQDITDIANSILNTDEERQSNIIFEGSPDYRQYLTGAVASRVCNKVQKPTFIYRLGQEESRGSVRVPRGVDAVLALKICSNLLLMFGGHKPAAGFSLLNENLDAFKSCLENHFKSL
ncbi:DHH family phosphoesterase [Candidatus Parcubacteria bacterium]|nr:DHH family phosphoesterase [Candidatus Parcubacteria bacterium]